MMKIKMLIAFVSILCLFFMMSLLINFLSSRSTKEKSPSYCLQQVTFKDEELESLLKELIVDHCFGLNDYGILDFYQSNINKNEYFIETGLYRYNPVDVGVFGYYIYINNIPFVLSKKIPKHLFNFMPISNNKQFIEELEKFGKKNLELVFGPDNYLLIYHSSEGRYKVKCKCI